MTENYLHYITHKMPKLIFLDGILVKKTYGDATIFNRDHMTGTLQITLFRIISLPQPIPEKINKKVLIFYYFYLYIFTNNRHGFVNNVPSYYYDFNSFPSTDLNR